MLQRAIPFMLFLATIPAANWTLAHVGTTCIPNGPCLVPAGFGLMGPSAALWAGIALALRDWLQETNGRAYVLVAIALGALLSFMLASPVIAIASTLAFIFAETVDFCVYTPLRNKNRTLAVFFSGVIGSLIDSVIFLSLAFGNLDAFGGMMLLKLYTTLAASLVVFALMNRKAA